MAYNYDENNGYGAGNGYNAGSGSYGAGNGYNAGGSGYSAGNGYNAGNGYTDPYGGYNYSGYAQEEPVPTGKYKPMGAWAYFGYNLLFSIPLVGFICLIIFSFSDGNINRRSYARSFWCAALVYLILFLVVLAVSLATGGAIMDVILDAI